MNRRDARSAIALDDHGDERRTQTLLALFVLAVLMLPTASGAQVSRPSNGGEQATAEDSGVQAIAAPTEPAVPESLPALDGLIEDGSDDPAGEDESAGEAAEGESAEGEAVEGEGAVVPEPPAAQESEEPEGPTAVQAEGEGTEEVVTAPVAPEGEVQAPADSAAAEEGPPAEVTLEPAPVTVTYGTSTVPSLGTTARPLTTDGLASPMVLVPMVAGADGQAGSTPVQVQPATALQTLAAPISGVAAGGLAGVQPSAAALVAAVLMVLIAAGYGAVLRQRGEEIPDAIRFTDAIRPADRRVTAVRSIRPADLSRSARSVRP